MIRIEDRELEEEVLAGGFTIAIPVEVYLPAHGEPEITTFALCEEIAREYVDKFAGKLLSDAALVWLGVRIEKKMEAYGYEYDPEASEVIEEYIAKHEGKLQTQSEALALGENREIYENKTNVEIRPENGGRDEVFVVVKNKKIVSLACVNDADYANGAAELYVETAPAYRNKGYGKTCVAALTNHLLQQGKTVWYKCYAKNSASAAVAKNCGFQLVGKRVALVCYATA